MLRFRRDRSSLPFSDDFSNTSSGWPHEKETDGGIYYKDGGYHVSAPAQNLLAVSPSETDTYQDVAVEVEAKVLNSQTDRIAHEALVTFLAPRWRL